MTPATSVNVCLAARQQTLEEGHGVGSHGMFFRAVGSFDFVAVQKPTAQDPCRGYSLLLNFIPANLT